MRMQLYWITFILRDAYSPFKMQDLFDIIIPDVINAKFSMFIILGLILLL